MSNSSQVNLFMNKFSNNDAEKNKCAEILNSYVPYEIQNSYIFKEIFNAYGDIFDKLEVDISDLFLQILPQTATEWGISLWEKRIGILTNTSKTLEERRARVLAKLVNKGTTTVEVIKQICRSFASEVEVVQHNSDYYFEINLLSSLGFPYSLEGMYDSIDIVKPAHLGTKYKLISLSKGKSYYKLATTTGEIITVYPWIARNIETSTKLEVGVSQNKGSETMTIYPLKV
jgi:P2-related tail formation protein